MLKAVTELPNNTKRELHSSGLLLRE